LVVTLVVPLKYLTVKPVELFHPWTAIASEWVPASTLARFPGAVLMVRVWGAGGVDDPDPPVADVARQLDLGIALVGRQRAVANNHARPVCTSRP
jgi:hypothetical protein